MKKTTAEEKMLALMAEAAQAVGMTEEFTQVAERTVNRKQNRRDIVSITEEEIQAFREVQGIMYFFQAPALWTAAICKRQSCRAPFLVSRKYVAYCSYTCIEKNMLEEWGTTWTFHKDGPQGYEAAANHIYEGNEPLWIRNLKSLESCLAMLQQILSSTSSNQTNEGIPSSSTQELKSDSQSSVPTPQTPSQLSSSYRPTMTSYGKIPIPKS